MKLIRYTPTEAGNIPVDINNSYTSGSWTYAKIDENRSYNGFYYVDVDYVEYASEPERILYEAIDAGYDTGLGYTLGLTDKDRAQFVSMLVLLREANAPDTMITAIADNTGTLHQLSVQALRQLLVNYGSYYQALWSA